MHLGPLGLTSCEIRFGSGFSMGATESAASTETQEVGKIIRMPAVVTHRRHFECERMWPNEETSALSCRALFLDFPSLAGQQNGARNGPLAASVIGDLTP